MTLQSNGSLYLEHLLRICLSSLSLTPIHFLSLINASQEPNYNTTLRIALFLGSGKLVFSHKANAWRIYQKAFDTVNNASGTALCPAKTQDICQCARLLTLKPKCNSLWSVLDQDKWHCAHTMAMKKWPDKCHISNICRLHVTFYLDLYHKTTMNINLI